METTTSLLLFTLLAGCGLASHLPPYFEICKASSEDIDECVRRSIQNALPYLENGIPELKFPSIQPIKIPSLTVGDSAGAVHVTQKYKNVEIYNVPKGQFQKVKLNLNDEKFHLHADAHFDELRLEGDYDFNGQILVIPVVGVGKCVITIYDVKAVIDIRAHMVERKNVKYLQFDEFKIKFEPNNATFFLSNLFDGNERLSTETLKVLNENWKEIIADIKPAYEDALGAVLLQLTNLAMKKVPFDEVFPE